MFGDVDIDSLEVALVTLFDSVSGFTDEKNKIGKTRITIMMRNQTYDTKRSITSVRFRALKNRPSFTRRTLSHFALNSV